MTHSFVMTVHFCVVIINFFLHRSHKLLVIVFINLVMNHRSLGVIFVEDMNVDMSSIISCDSGNTDPFSLKTTVVCVRLLQMFVLI